ncbi:hypothetical protein [Paraburkholderia phenazinium]|uniref:Uncharacterized protein n=1 Tax=Paraburkholderia phenazinium TaxID=60549 RepID=A0A1G7U5C1_9BURK|nr:hypothetical protein [Paraburkholderia phenazinium]SDG42614.1 hypothetical protein SAMN05216466_103306 [Paraburkholderia phenazinium]
MNNGIAQSVAVKAADDLISIWNRVFGTLALGDCAILDNSLRDIAARANREFEACGALTDSRRQMLSDALSELVTAREASNRQDLMNMTSALRRATGRINALIVDVMTNLG